MTYNSKYIPLKMFLKFSGKEKKIVNLNWQKIFIYYVHLPAHTKSETNLLKIPRYIKSHVYAISNEYSQS